MNNDRSWTYCQFLDALYRRTRVGEKFDLEGPRNLESAIGHPLTRYPSIIIGGTNGKGSTCAFLETLLRGHGLKTGLFTSPHLIAFTERIRIDGQSIGQDWLLRDGLDVLRHADTLEASFFEATWALACRAFADFNVDVAVWEVGLGGRLDATNVAEPIASGITSIGLDHVDVLGETLEAIAREKAAIFRTNVPAFTSATGAGLDALKGVAPEHLRIVEPSSELPKLPLPGVYQRHNAALALALARTVTPSVDPEHLTQTTWPGRAERIGAFILDCAHNPAAMDVFGQWLTTEHQGPFDVIFGAMEGKDVAGLVEGVERWATRVTLVAPQYPRRLNPEAIEPMFSMDAVRIIPCVRDAIIAADESRVTVICGSGFLAGEARAVLLDLDYPECGLLTRAR